MGQLLFDYETVNIVTKQESVKNADKNKKAESELTVINIEDMQYQLSKGGDIMFKIIVGSNSIKTNLIEKSQGSGSVVIKDSIYADSK